MPAYAYAINANHGGLATYPDLLDNSLTSLRPHLSDPAQVHIIYTDPRDADHIESLRDRGYTVHERADPDIPNGASMKCHLCEIDADELVFLDADTVIYRDPGDLFDREFTFAARPDGGLPDVPPQPDTRGDAPVTVHSTGFMLFTGGSHRQLGEPWRRYWRALNAGQIDAPGRPARYNEMFAFALALRSVVTPGEIWALNERHQALERFGEGTDTYVRELRRFGGRSWDEITAETAALVG